MWFLCQEPCKTLEEARKRAMEIRARQSENYKAMNKIRESVFTGSFLVQNSSNMYHNFSTDL